MSAERHGMSHHPAPHRGKVALWESVLGLGGGPIGWLIQLAAGYVLVSKPCYAGPDPAPAGDGTLPALIVYLLCLALALCGGIMSLRLWWRTREEKEGQAQDLLEVGHGRTRFLALWGVLLGFGFAGVILLNGIALLGVPPCAL